MDVFLYRQIQTLCLAGLRNSGNVTIVHKNFLEKFVMVHRGASINAAKWKNSAESGRFSSVKEWQGGNSVLA
jgi:hypothetical protein